MTHRHTDSDRMVRSLAPDVGLLAFNSLAVLLRLPFADDNLIEDVEFRAIVILCFFHLSIPDSLLKLGFASC